MEPTASVSNTIHLNRVLRWNRAVAALAMRPEPSGKRCSACGEWKRLTEFHSQPTGKYGRHSYCAVCACAKQKESRVRNYSSDQKERWQLKTRYGLTPDQRDQMLESQDGKCAICGKPPARPCIDHNHETGDVRAILCHRCNIGLPYVEDISFRESAIAYLNEHATRRSDSLNFLSVCSGIEAASVAFGPIGWKPIAFAEIEKFPSAVLAHHYPDVPNLGDFTKIDTTQLGRVDVLCGGTPCQSFSLAGARRGLNDARGNLTLSFVELAHELADGNGLRNVIWENVPGVLSDKTNAFGCFLAGLVGADSPIVSTGKWSSYGMVAGPKARVAWAVKDAQFHGLAQRRKRVIVVADFGNGADPAAVLFEPESVRRDSPPSRETGQSVAASVAPSLTASGRGVERTDDPRGQDPVVAVPRKWPVDVAPTLNAAFGSKQGLEDQHALGGAGLFVPVSVTGPISHALKAEGADASEDGTGRGTPIVTYTEETTGALTLGHGGGAAHQHRQGDNSFLIAQTVALRGREGGDKPHVLYAPEIYPTLSSSEGGTLTQIPPIVTSAVRRLTPRECERLQGFPDDYTRIPWRNRPADQCPDGPRYKALGNSWAVPLFTWLGERIQRFMPPR